MLRGPAAHGTFGLHRGVQTLRCGSGIRFPDQGWDLGPSALGMLSSLATGLPRKGRPWFSLKINFPLLPRSGAGLHLGPCPPSTSSVCPSRTTSNQGSAGAWGRTTSPWRAGWGGGSRDALRTLFFGGHVSSLKLGVALSRWSGAGGALCSGKEGQRGGSGHVWVPLCAPASRPGPFHASSPRVTLAWCSGARAGESRELG